MHHRSDGNETTTCLSRVEFILEKLGHDKQTFFTPAQLKEMCHPHLFPKPIFSCPICREYAALPPTFDYHLEEIIKTTHNTGGLATKEDNDKEKEMYWVKLYPSTAMFS